MNLCFLAVTFVRNLWTTELEDIHGLFWIKENTSRDAWTTLCLNIGGTFLVASARNNYWLWWVDLGWHSPSQVTQCGSFPRAAVCKKLLERGHSSSGLHCSTQLPVGNSSASPPAPVLAPSSLELQVWPEAVRMGTLYVVCLLQASSTTAPWVPPWRWKSALHGAAGRQPMFLHGLLLGWKELLFLSWRSSRPPSALTLKSVALFLFLFLVPLSQLLQCVLKY